MRNHLNVTLAESSADYSVLFREMFCVAAHSLATSLTVPIETLGVLDDKIIDTGMQRSKRQKGAASGLTLPDTHQFGRGQFVFLVKHASRSEAEHLQSSGYRFAEQNNVIGTVSRAMQIEPEYAGAQIRRMNDYYGPQYTFAPGVHVGFFGMRPNVQKGFNVVVKENQSYSIPSSQLPFDSLTPAQEEFLMQYVGKGVETILKELRAPQPVSPDFDMQRFRYFICMFFLH
jgi:hypothetical protein